MALYSLNVSSIGRTTHAAGTAGAHIRYICREDANPEILSGGGLPIDPQEARNFLDRGERADRANARVADKIRAALPVELDQAQRAQLVRDFAQHLSEGRVPWFAAIHQSGEDEHNPHVHLLIRDRDKETGKRTVRLSDSARDWKSAGRPGDAPCAYVRELWENIANQALERAGRDERIDRRSLEDRGIDREPQIHLGPAGQYVETHKHRPHSKDVKEKSWRRTQYREQTPYEAIDRGRTRRERNAEIIDLNLERAARSTHQKTRLYALLEQQERKKDRDLSAAYHSQFRRQTYERDCAAAKFRARREDITARKSAELDFVYENLRVSERRKQAQLAQHHQLEMRDARSEHKRWSARLMRYIDLTGRTRKAQEAEIIALGERHSRERKAADREHRAEERLQADFVRKRYAAEFLDVRRERASALRELAVRHENENRPYQEALQQREAEREQARAALARYIQANNRSQQPRPNTDAGREQSGAESGRPESQPADPYAEFNDIGRDYGRSRDDGFEHER